MANTYTDEDIEAQDASQNSNGSTGWEVGEYRDPNLPAEKLVYAPHRGRHTYRDGVCIRCGRREDDTTPTKTQRQEITRSVSKSVSLDTLISGVWMAAGIGLEKQPWILRTPAAEGMASPAEAVGKVLQLESAVAGKKIEKALRGTAVYKLLHTFLNSVGPWAKLAPLLMPPLIVGIASVRPDIGERFRPMMVAAMVPMLVEAAKMQEEQARLVAQMEEVSADMISAANALVDELLGTKQP